MKLTKVISLTLLIVLSSTMACKDDFLEVLPTGSLSEAQLTSRAGLESTLISSYAMLLGRGGFYDDASNWFWGSVSGGEANKGTNAGDQAVMNEVQRYETLPTNGEVRNKYARCYEGIARANTTLRLLPNAAADVTAANKTRLEAEAKFLRALYYFELKRIYNNTPYIDENWDGGKVQNNQDLFPKIEADLQFAFQNLPATQSQAGRVNKWAAGAYLAKVYLYQKKYTQAKTLFDDIIANGVTTRGQKYALMPRYGDLFRAANDNNAESVFAVQAAAGTGSINNAFPANVLNFPYNGGPAGCCGFYQPSFDLANSFRTDANGLPILDGSYNNTTNRLKTDMGISSAAAFTPEAGSVDPRLDHTVGRRGIPYLDWGPHPGLNWIRDQSYGGPYAPKKWVYSQAEGAANLIDKSSWTPGYLALNVVLVRFADVLLMAAEAEIEVGSLEKAREYVNLVRARAANPDSWVKMGDGSNAANYVIGLYNTPWTSKPTATAAVQMERKLELAMEGHRFFDLVRWGVAPQVLNAYLANEVANIPSSGFVGATFQATDIYQPIPQDEIDLLGRDVLQQNPGY